MESVLLLMKLLTGQKYLLLHGFPSFLLSEGFRWMLFCVNERKWLPLSQGVGVVYIFFGAAVDALRGFISCPFFMFCDCSSCFFLHLGQLPFVLGWQLPFVLGGSCSQFCITFWYTPFVLLSFLLLIFNTQLPFRKK